MELFGGLGFLEDYAVSRLHREALVTSIWEGASNIQALEMLEAMQKKGAHEAFLDEFVPMLERAGTPAASLARDRLQATLDELSGLPPRQAQWQAKAALATLADAAQVALLYDLAESDVPASASQRYARLAELYAAHFLQGQPYPATVLDERALWLPESIEQPPAVL
jgi:acyl-CoA dehydrogenase